LNLRPVTVRNAITSSFPLPRPHTISVFDRSLHAKESVAKRFKLTARGKLVRRTPGFRHLLASKSTKSKRRASRDKLVAEGHAKALKRCLPFGL
jgi:large subunit ribosomal protein L35